MGNTDLDSGRDETFEVTRARHQGATDMYHPIQGTAIHCADQERSV
jgi:hypothetical protein